MQRLSSPQKWQRPALSAGARAGDAFIANVRAAAEQVQANRAGAAAARDPEFLHQLRVGLRRLRATLRAFRPLVRRKEADRIEHRLRAALRAFGAARDWDVFVQAFRRAKLPRRAHAQAEATRRRSCAMARSATLRFLPDEVLAWARTRPWRKSANPGEASASFGVRALERATRRLARSAAGLDWNDAPRRHRVRILVKRLRYACECFAAAWPDAAMEPFLKELRRLQEILGELNDIDVQRRLLDELAKAGVTARWHGAASRALARRERPRVAKVRRAWQALAALSPFWREPEPQVSGSVRRAAIASRLRASPVAS